MLRKYLYNQKGMVLPLVLILFMVLFLLSVVALNISSADNRHSTYQAKRMQAYYLARSGAEALGNYIVNQSESLTPSQLGSLINNISNITSEEIKLDDNDEGYFEILVEQNDDELNIISTGNVGDVQDTVILTLNKTTESILADFEHALFADNKITFSGSTKILGSVASSFTSASQISFNSSGGQYIDGDIYLLNSSLTKSDIAYSEKILGNLKVIPAPMTFTMPSFPDFDEVSSSLPIIESKLTAGWNPSPPYVISSSGWYKEGIQVNSRLEINVGDEDLIIRTKNLNISGSGGSNRGIYINRTGTGKLYLYIDEDFTVTSSGVINPDGNPEDALIFFKSSNFAPAGNPIIKSLLYGENAMITIGHSANIQGHIITGGNRVTISGAGTAVVRAIYAPNATVNMEGSGSVKGIIISNELNMSGNSSLEYTDLSGDSSLDMLLGKTSYRYTIWR
ncbi:hypothetical protein SAMN05660297_00358 [Natronincola peptidivorans]|uniref:DUF7305 domain-containing protein n=1 Tax=Natronincola peptidivorans TaxID=426128 RepID=A0A1H9YQY0_9FIRM|nr:pilus assembly PilX N-terminal domain-containing protein [Natronincola peptidivorans]SES71473.1 hypothetical protein SAMN05660297_00358 [Natronincola peptidivorans]